MVLYENGVIYKLCCNDTNITDIYIGATTNFRQRKNTHKRNLNSKEKLRLKVYIFINNNGGFSNWSMIEIEKYKASDRHDLLKRERYWMEQMKPTLNSSFSFSTSEQKKINKDKYYKSEKNRERQKLYDQERKSIPYTCECGVTLKSILYKSTHNKSKKHYNFINTIIPEPPKCGLTLESKKEWRKKIRHEYYLKHKK